jgi:hypothetical protein
MPYVHAGYSTEPQSRPTFMAPAAWAQPGNAAYRSQPLTLNAGGVTIVMDDTHLRLGPRAIALAEITAVAFPGMSQSLGPVERIAVSTRDESLTIPLASDGQPRTPAARADIERLLDRLWTDVMPRVAADTIDHVAYGLSLHIGRLRLERLGFGANGQMYPWNTYGGLNYQADGVTIAHFAHGRSTPITQVGSGDLNAAIMPTIVQHLARNTVRSHPLTASERNSIDIGPRPRTALAVGGSSHVTAALASTGAEPRRKRPMKGIGALIVVMVLLALGTYARRAAFSTESKPARTKVSTWDSRVTDLVAFVEKEHGKPFKHPVAMTFLNDAAFLKRLHKDDRKPKNAKTAEAKQATTEAIMRARGYAGPALSLDASKDQSDGRVRGVYFSDTDEIAVRGDYLDAFGKLVIVHELTHAWQHQHYPVDKLGESLKSETDLFLYTSLLEGDARRIENRYFRTAPASEQKAIASLEDEVRGNNTLDSVPGPVVALSAAPYEIGELFTSHRAMSNTLDEQYDKLAIDQRSVLLPDLAGATPAPEPPNVLDGEKALSLNDYQIGYMSDGALSLFLTLSSRLDAQVAWRAATIPNLGMTSIALRQDRRVCVRSAMQIDDDTNRATLNEALAAWIAAGPPDVATVAEEGKLLVFTSCDPGKQANVPPKEIFGVLYREVLAERLAGARFETEGVDRPRSTCALEKFRSRFDITTLTDDDLKSADMPAPVVEAADAALAGC